MPTSSCTCRAERPETLVTPPGGSWPTTPNTGTGNCPGSGSTPTAAGRLPSEGESYAQSAHSELNPRQGGFSAVRTWLCAAPRRRGAAHSVSEGEDLSDPAVAATAGDHQRGAADAQGADRGDRHAHDVRTGDGQRAGRRGGGGPAALVTGRGARRGAGWRARRGAGRSAGRSAQRGARRGARRGAGRRRALARRRR